MVAGNAQINLPPDYEVLHVHAVFTAPTGETASTIDVFYQDVSGATVTRFYEFGNADTRFEFGLTKTIGWLSVATKGGVDYLGSTSTKIYYK